MTYKKLSVPSRQYYSDISVSYTHLDVYKRQVSCRRHCVQKLE